MNKKSIAVINPIPSKKYLYEKMTENGINCHAVYTRPFPDLFRTVPIDNSLFDSAFIINQEKISEIKNILLTLKIDYILCGSEDSCNITDLIIESMHPVYANDSSTSNSRNNKYIMQQRLKENGVNSIESLKINLQSEYIESFDISWPRFCKPTTGAASIGAFVAKNNNEFNEKTNTQYQDYVIQELLIGDEYFVDTFSVSGEHFVSSVQRYEKTIKNSIPIPQYNEIVTDPDLRERCVNYVFQCLDACGLKNGFAHTEVFLTQDDFKLIEINNRISGASGMPNKMATCVGLQTQPDLLICFLKNGLPGLRELSPVQKGYSRMIPLHKNNDGILKDPTDVLNVFNSVKEIYFLFQPGMKTYKSHFGDLTTVCFVLLFSEDINEIERDTQAILLLEADNSFLDG